MTWSDGGTRTFGLRDLVLANLGALEYAGADQDLRDHHAERYRALVGRLGVDLAQPVPVGRGPDDPARWAGLASSWLRRAAEQHSREQAFFSGVLEVPSELGPLVSRHSRTLTELSRRKREALEELMVELAEFVYGPMVVSLTAQEVQALGLDRAAPDPLDYW